MSDKIHKVLNDLVSAVLKAESSPIAAETHLDSAIVRLLELAPDWKPSTKEAEAVVESAKTHLHFYKPPAAETILC